MAALSHFYSEKPALAVSFAPRCNKQRMVAPQPPDEPHYLKPSRLLVPIYRAPMRRTENLV
jgi:hypothetical protein